MKIPLSVLLISILYIIAGAAGVVYHFKDPISAEYFWLLAVRLLAVAAGIFALRGANWARWALVLWIAFHVGISLFHDLGQTLAHIGFLVLTVLALFNKKAKEWFMK